MENFFVYFYSKKNPSKFFVEQRAKSNEQRAKTNEQRAKTNEQRAKRNDQRAKANDQCAKSNEQQATSKKLHLFQPIEPIMWSSTSISSRVTLVLTL